MISYMFLLIFYLILRIQIDAFHMSDTKNIFKSVV